jgi:hypothetical protein
MNSPTTAPADHPAACAPTHPQSKGWLTAVLRPAGTLDDTAFGRLLAELSATADMVVVDLDAVRIPNLAAFLDALRPAAARLARPGRCLLLVNAPGALEHALLVADVPAATLAADTMRPPAQPPRTDQSQPDATDPRPSQEHRRLLRSP